MALATAGFAGTREPVVLKPNGGWCWFQDERAIVCGGKLIFGTVAGSTRDGSDAGDVEVTAVELGSHAITGLKLHPRLQADDHDAPAFLELADGRILATYQTHGGEDAAGIDLMRWRVTERPGDPSSWGEERSVPVGATVSYSNPFQLAAEGGRIYLFHRGFGYNPNYLVSDDGAHSFAYGGRLLRWPRPVGALLFTGIDGGRPYAKYAQEGNDTIHLVCSDDHPRAYDNGIHHAFIRSGVLHHSDGRPIAPLSMDRERAPRPDDLTTVFRGDADHVAWPCDVHIDDDGHPRIVFSVQRGGASFRGQRGAEGDGQDHRFYYARWNGAQWDAREIAHAGSRLYPTEEDYTGLAAIDPQRPDVVFVSTNADPETGRPLVSAADGRRHHEIFQGTTGDGGRSWTWLPVTRDSSCDNLRPIVPIWSDARGRTIVLWLRGNYRSYTDYDLDVVGLLPAESA